MNRYVFMLIACLIAIAATMPRADAQVGFDRPGGAYNSFTVRSGDPAVCSARCDRDNRCRAWSFSFPNTASKEATCWLKSKVTPAKEDTCCTSGVRGSGVVEPRTGAIEFSIERPGADIRWIEIASDPTGQACAKACEAEAKCRAFTYIRPGYAGTAARCYLKDKITRPRRKPCCISGVVR